MGVVNEITIRRGDVFLVELNPTRGSEIRKARPCVIVMARRVKHPPAHLYRRPPDLGKTRLPFPRVLPFSKPQRSCGTRPDSHRGPRTARAATGPAVHPSHRTVSIHPARNVRALSLSKTKNGNSQCKVDYVAKISSIICSSSSAKSKLSKTLKLSSICSGRLAPHSAVVTASWRRTQAMAICASV
jgi:hypothetical protein